MNKVIFELLHQHITWTAFYLGKMMDCFEQWSLTADEEWRDGAFTNFGMALNRIEKIREIMESEHESTAE